MGYAKSREDLFCACRDGNLPLIEQLLSESPRLIHARDTDSSSPLIIASYHRHSDVARFLLSNMCNVHAKDLDGNTALHMACRAPASLPLIQVLLEHNANVQVPNIAGETPFILATSCAVANTEVVQTLLRHGASDTSQALLCVNPLTSLPSLEALVQHGAQVNALDSRGHSPLIRACIHDHVPSIRLLLSHGADREGRDCQGCSPLMRALDVHSNQAAQELVEGGADIHAPNRLGDTPFFRACRMGNLDAIYWMVRMRPVEYRHLD